MESEDSQLVEAIGKGIKTKGLYGFVKLVLQVAREHRKCYEDNPEAIIHEDVKELSFCVNLMASKHPIRFYEEPFGE